MICKKCKKDIPEGATKCPECQSDLRNWFVRHKIISGIIILFVLGFILSALGNEDSSNVSSQADSSEPREYVEVIALNTTSTTNSDTFVLEGGKQKLTYTIGSGQFSMCNVYLLDEGVDLQSDGGFPVVALAEDSGETILRKSEGSYYLSVQASNTDCSVKLEEER